MSSVSYNEVCPCCGYENAEYYSENRPFEFVSITCSNCGFYVVPVVERLSFNDVIELRNDQRENNDEELLSEKEVKELKKEYDKHTKTFKEDFWGYWFVEETK